MAYDVTGTAGGDTLDQSGNPGPGTIVGLAGSDCLLTGSGDVSVTGNSGSDTIVLQAGNTGTVNGTTESDSIVANGAIGSMVLFAGDGADTIDVGTSTSAQTIVGGNNSSDAADSIISGGGADIVYGNGGNDTIAGGAGNDTLVAGFGDDLVTDAGGTDLVFANEGNDTIAVSGGADTVFAGQGNDSILHAGSASPLYFLNEGSDTVSGAGATGAMTVVGGQDSTDGADSILTGSAGDFVFGNGGADTIGAGDGANTIVGGFGGDTIASGSGTDLIFANENGDTVSAGDGANTVFGGLGDDFIIGGSGRDTLQGNEDNDTIDGGNGIDTVSGGVGNDMFVYLEADDDGNNAAGGGPVEQVTDVNLDQDIFLTTVQVTFAADIGAGSGANLNAAANTAIGAAYGLAGGGANQVAAQFTFGGRTYLAINQDGTLNAFDDAGDILLDITGVVGTIDAGDFDRDDPPVAVDDSATVAEDSGPNPVNVTANDTDPDGGPKTITAATDPANGTVVITGGGSGLTYQPDADFNGTDTFTYTLNGSTTATVTVTVTPVADIADNSATTNEDSAVNVLVLGNDTFEATPAITGTTNGANGTVAVNDNGTPGNSADDFVTYTPAADFSGTDSFTYTVTSNGTTETATVSVTVDPVPDAVNDTATTNEDTPVNILVQANDTFAGTTAITGTTNGSNGAVTVNDNGTPGNTADDFVVYTPNADFNGTDSFTYTVTSGGVTETATVSVTVAAVADIAGDSATTNEDTAVNVLVLGNDTFEATPAITGTSNGANGSVAVNDNGTPGNTADDFVVYTPNADFSGNDTFTYTVTSGGVTETATVSVTVSAVADIVNDSATTNEDTTASILVLGNDTFEATPAITGTTNGANGTVAVDDNGTAGNTADDFVVYTPDADFNGTDTFTYTVTSGGATETATVSVTVAAVADIAADSATTGEDAPVNVLVLGNDTFEATPAITATTNGAGGTVAVDDNGTAGDTTDDFVVYTPNGDFNGTDSFTYTVTSGGVTETATVSVTVTAVADIAGDSATTNEDTAANVLVLANDTFEGTEAITGTTNGTNGTVAVNNNATPGDTTDDFVVYTPNADFNGADSFTYTVTSGGTTETATVSVTISAVQDAFDDTATVSQNTNANPINVLANDNFEGTEQIAAVTQGTSGTVAIADNGTPGNTADDFVTYTPNTGFTGDDTFTYTVTSPTGTPETATVSVSVSPDVAPTAVTDSATVAEDALATAIDVLANDTDPDGGPKTVQSTSDPANGTVAITGGGTGLTYQPDADFNGTETFTYTLNGGSTTTVTVTVTPVADIAGDSATVNEDSGTNNLNLLANDTFENPGRAITAVGTATHGIVAIDNNGTAGDATDDFVTYTTNDPDFNGTDSFTYTVTSGGVTETATASVTISAVADIVNDTATTNEDTAVNVLVLGNDTFEDTEAITGTTNGTNGTVAVNDNGTPGISDDDFVIYTPTADFNGTDSFTYTVTSGGVTETGTVSVTISAVADIAGDSVTVDEDSGVNNLNLLANDSFENTGRSITAVGGTPAHGTVAINNNGTLGDTTDDFVTYTTTDADFFGSDSFTYTVTSGGATETATVSVDILPVNDAPVAADFTFTGANGAIGNTSLVVNDPTDGAPDPAGPQRTVSGDILAGATDVDTALNLLTITAETITNASGQITFEADGDFTYLPAADFLGNATFTYTLNDNDPLGNATDTGTITISVPAPHVWYVDPDAATNGDGTSDNPFNTLDALNGLTGDGTTNDDLDGANDIIFVYGGTLGSGITLEDGQQLIGQSVGLTVSGTALEAAAGSNPLINGAVVLASGNTINGIDIGNAAGFALSGTSIGTASFSNGSINNTTGGALSITTGGTLNATFTNFSSSAGTNAVNLVGVNGTVSLGTGALSNATLTTFNVNGGAASITYNGTITDDVGQLIAVANHTGGTIDFNGAISDGGDGDGSGISLTNNTGATVRFDGGLTLSTGANAAFAATGGGTVAVTDPGGVGVGVDNTIVTTIGTALNIANTNIHADDLTFRSIASNGAVNGIVLNSTGTTASFGGLIVTGDASTAANGSGGIIQNSTGTGILLTSTRDVSLDQVNVTGSGDDGIHGVGVVNFTLNRSNINTNGNSTADDGLQFGEASGSVVGVTGNVSILNTSISGNAHNNVHFRNTSGTIDNLTVTGSTFNDLNDTFGANSFLFEASGTSTITEAFITDSTFSNNSPQRALEVQAHDTATISDFVVSGNRFANNGIHASFTQDTSSNLEFYFVDNGGLTAGSAMTGTVLQFINVFSSSTSTGGTIVGTISGNRTDSGATNASGISAVIQGLTDATLLIDGNTINNVSGARGISVAFRGPTSAVGPATINDVTITNNNVDNDNGGPATFPLSAISVEADNQSGSFASAPTVRADIRGNTVPSGSAFDLTTGFLQFYEYDGDATPGEGADGIGQLVDTPPASANADAQLSSTNTGSVGSFGITLIAGPINTPPSVPTPLLALVGGVESAAGEQGEFHLTQADLDLAVGAAIERWASAGLSATQLAMLQSLDFSVTDLGGAALGRESPGQVLIDNDGAGFGWFVDATPLEDAEFGTAVTDSWLLTDQTQAPAGDMDLLTAVMHEMGHALGLDDTYALANGDDLMFGFLVTGERRLPGSADVARAGFDYSAEELVLGADGGLTMHSSVGCGVEDSSTDFATPNYARCGTVDVTGGDTMVMHQMA